MNFQTLKRGFLIDLMKKENLFFFIKLMEKDLPLLERLIIVLKPVILLWIYGSILWPAAFLSPLMH
jgi:hypothetical protein